MRNTWTGWASAIGLVLSVGAGTALVSAQAPASQAPAQQAAAAPAGNAENGKALYKSVGCYQCHGWEAHGAPGTGPRLAPNPLPYPRLSSYVRGPSGQMPAYGPAILSDQGLADIFAFLRAAPRPPALSTLPLLAADQFK